LLWVSDVGAGVVVAGIQMGVHFQILLQSTKGLAVLIDPAERVYLPSISVQVVSFSAVYVSLHVVATGADVDVDVEVDVDVDVDVLYGPSGMQSGVLAQMSEQLTNPLAFLSVPGTRLYLPSMDEQLSPGTLL